MIKIRGVVILIALFLLPVCFADVMDIETRVYVKIYENNTVNISTEDGDYIYTTYQNSTNNFYIDLERNVTNCDDLTDSFNNLTSYYSSLSQTCSEYSDSSKDRDEYFKLYTSCDADKKILDSEKSTLTNSVAELQGFKSSSATCDSNYKVAQEQLDNLNVIAMTMQNNATSCNSNLKAAKNNQWLFLGLGALAIGGAWAWNNRKKNPNSRLSKIARS